MKRRILFISGMIVCCAVARGQVQLAHDFVHESPDTIGTFQGITFHEGGFSALFYIAQTNGAEFWTCSDRGVNIDCEDANPDGCHPTYDKLFAFPDYAPKIHRIRLAGNAVQVVETMTIKRPDGTDARGVLNPTGYGSTAEEQASTDTVNNCADFSAKIAAKDPWALDPEGLIVDADGNFWLSEENGPTIWKVDADGVVLNRFTPYADQSAASPLDIPIDTVFKYRKNNRGFESLTQTPNGKIYTIIQSPILYPNEDIGEESRIHRILEIDPQTHSTKMYAYVNDGKDGSGDNKIRKRDRKIGDMAAINDSTFLVMEAALRGTNDQKKIYLINLANATPITSGLYGGKTIEELEDSAGLAAYGITPVAKTLFLDLNANGWPPALEKAEGIAIINDSTLAVSNDNDFGQVSPLENGMATATHIRSHVIVFDLKGDRKVPGYVSSAPSGVPSIEQNQHQVLIYPNPARDQIQVQILLDAAQSVSVRLRDVTGRVIRSQTLSASQKGVYRTTMDVKDIADGFCFVELAGEHFIKMEKVMIMH